MGAGVSGKMLDLLKAFAPTGCRGKVRLRTGTAERASPGDISALAKVAPVNLSGAFGLAIKNPLSGVTKDGSKGLRTFWQKVR